MIEEKQTIKDVWRAVSQYDPEYFTGAIISSAFLSGLIYGSATGSFLGGVAFGSFMAIFCGLGSMIVPCEDDDYFNDRNG